MHHKVPTSAGQGHSPRGVWANRCGFRTLLRRDAARSRRRRKIADYRCDPHAIEAQSAYCVARRALGLAGTLHVSRETPSIDEHR